MNELLLRTRKNNLPRSQFTFIVSKKVAPLAVARNRTKRLLREATRHLPVPGGFDYTLIVKTDFSKMKEQDVEKLVAKLLNL